MHILNFTLCYPPGEYHPEALLDLPPEDIELADTYEIYEFQTSDSVPVVGKVIHFPDLGGYWVVAKVESYQPEVESNLDGFHVVLCTRDGRLLERQDGSYDFRVLGLVMEGDTIGEREPRLADWWVGSESSLPRPSARREVLLFKPTGDPGGPCEAVRSPQGFDVVAICRTLAARVAV